MKRFYTLFFIVLSFGVFTTYANKRKLIEIINKDSTIQSPVIKQFIMNLDSLHTYYLGSLDAINSDTVTNVRNIEEDAHYYKLYLPLTFYRAAVDQAFIPIWPNRTYQSESYPVDSILPYDKSKFTQYRDADRRINRALLSVYTADHCTIERWGYQIEGLRIFIPRRRDMDVNDPHIIALFRPDPGENHWKPIHVKIHKPNFWCITGSGALQFSQAYVSGNWYKGGESNDLMTGNLQIDANYNDKEKLQWDNRLEAKGGFQTEKSDSIHRYLINDNLLRITSKLGLQATKHWYYTFSLEFNTQFFNNYKANVSTRQSAFLSPANLIASLGMDFKRKTRKIDLSMVLAPAAYNLRYIRVDDIDETAYGMTQGERFLQTVGSTMTTNLVWTLNPAISYTTRLYYFSNYKSTQAEWENTINFVLNRYLSTKIFFHGRFDDSSTKDNDMGYFQFKELLSFGINYAW